MCGMKGDRMPSRWRLFPLCEGTSYLQQLLMSHVLGVFFKVFVCVHMFHHNLYSSAKHGQREGEKLRVKFTLSQTPQREPFTGQYR